MIKLQGYKVNFAIHPGKTLIENLEYLNLSQSELSERTGITEKHISNIINEKASITPETAIKLEKVLGISASFWNNLEKNYQFTIAQIKATELQEQELNYLSGFKETYSELSKNKFLQRKTWHKNNFLHILSDLQSFFGVDSLKYVKDTNLQAAYRKYKNKTNENTVAAWLRLGQLKARKVEISVFDGKKLEDNLDLIKSLSMESIDTFLPKLEKILAECGVVLVCAPYFKNTYTQGATQWFSKDKAFIIIKTTHQSEDKFWFNLFHEICHLLKHGKSKTFIDLEDKIDSDEELEADRFAQNVLLPNFNKDNIKNYENFNMAMKEIAMKNQVSSSIVAGRFAYENKDYPQVYKLVSPFIKMMNIINV